MAIQDSDQGVFGQPLARHEPTPMELMQSFIEKGGDPKDLTVMVDLKERIDRNNAAEAYAEAVAEFQSRCPPIHKGREVRAMGYSFASFDDIMRVVQPILRDCGLSVAFSTKMIDGMIEATCTVRHGIHSEPHTVTLPLPGGMKVNDTQKAGAALSYAKRYSLCGALNIVVTDDDTDAAGMETVSEAEADTLDNMIRESGANRKKFLDWAGVEKLSEFPASKYQRGLDMLRKKLADAKGGKA